MEPLRFPARTPRRVGAAVLAVAALLAVVSARPYAGGWNDGSRLATVESLVDRGTLAIDDSIFVRVPDDDAAPLPYPPDDALLREQGTLDKILVDGRYYSDKSPVPALPLAGVYRAWVAATGLTARARPDLFCLLLTLVSSGLAYVVAVGCVDRLGVDTGLSLGYRLSLTASFALGTLALPYARHVNNHSLLLGVAAALTLGLARLARAAEAGRLSWRLPALLGALAGFGYTVDLGAGPVLFACTLALAAWRCRRPRLLLAFVLAALPWLALHHALNYAVGGTLAPANSVAHYLTWPGSPFNEQNMTGGWKHASAGQFLLYAADLLVGRRGFLGHNLPLLLAPAALGLFRRRPAERPELLYALGLCGGVWLIYAVNSTNHAGRCLSIRWFLPLLAPGYYALAVLLRERPRLLGDLLLLGGWGAVVAALGWWQGPWERIGEAWLWPVRAGVLLSWAGYRLWRDRAARTQDVETRRPPLAA